MGNAIQIGQESPSNILNMFYAMENGTAKTGEFSVDEYLPNTETLIFQSGLEEIKGYMIIDADWYPGAINSERTVFAYRDFDTNISIIVNSTTISNSESLQSLTSFASKITRGTVTIDGGDFYVTADYNKNSGYTPFEPGHRYVWVAW